MTTLQAIIFDMDGTLADTEDIHRQAFNLAFLEFGCDWQWSRDEYRRLLAVSGGRERIRQYLARRRADGDAAELSALAVSMHARKSAIYRELLAGTGIRLRPGIERLIREATGRRIRLGVATSSSRRNFETLLQSTLGSGGPALFNAVVTSDIVEEKKPSPAVYLRAISDLGAVPARCVAIEDTRNGNLAALAAGTQTVITTHAFTLDNDFSGAALVVDQLGEPGQAMRVLAGDPAGARYVDVGLLERIVAEHGRRDAGLSQAASALLAK
jgi:HAD superfamily hydrolase (TIGR01509 family)